MCLLSYYPAGIMPDEFRLGTGAVNNSDGHGYAIADVTAGKLITGHGMHASAVINEFMAERDAHPDGPAMFHSRFSTGGTVDTYNCHPFKVGRDKKTVVGHNGVFFATPAGDKRSDTRIFAESIMPRKFPALDSARTRRRLEKFLGGYNKIAVITVNPAYRHNGYLFNEQAGHWIAGEWHSNYDYEQARTWVISSGSMSGYVKGDDGVWRYDPAADTRPRWWERDHGIACDFCGEGVLDEATLICRSCRSCADCGEDELDCQCYVPRAARRELPEVSDGYGNRWSAREEAAARFAALEAAKKADDQVADQCEGCTEDDMCAFCRNYYDQLAEQDHGDCLSGITAAELDA